MNTTETVINDITPQRLGSIVKASGVRKSKNKKGNFYNYNTEGYRIDRHWKGRYTIEYLKELRFTIMTEGERDSFERREKEALSAIAKTLTDKAIKFEVEGDTITLYLAQN
jgi:hypothetical protein